jgi:hypothetical protein
MSSIPSEHDLFKPKQSKAESKADTTNRTARGIIGAEAQKRDAKTARLRQARLEKEAVAPVTPAPPTKLQRRKAPTARRIKLLT